MDCEFRAAVLTNHVAWMEDLLARHDRGEIIVDLNLGEKQFYNRAPLHVACLYEGKLEALALLLKRSEVNVNLRDGQGNTPLQMACDCKLHNVVRLLLESGRADCNKGGDSWSPPFTCCFNDMHHHFSSRDPFPREVMRAIQSQQQTVDNLICLKWLLALIPLELDLNAKGQDDYGSKRRPGWYSPLEIARERHHDLEIVGLLSRFGEHRVLVAHQLRLELAYPRALAAHAFALIALCADRYLKRRKNNCLKRSLHFFRMALRLPLDLQMLLCNRLAGLAGLFVLSKDLDPAVVNVSLLFTQQ